jgi:hypothetical protein
MPVLKLVWNMYNKLQDVSQFSIPKIINVLWNLTKMESEFNWNLSLLENCSSSENTDREINVKLNPINGHRVTHKWQW